MIGNNKGETMGTGVSVKEFEEWATDRGLSIETAQVQVNGTTLFGYVDRATAMACEGWLGRGESQPSSEDHGELLKKIVEIVADEKKWAGPHLIALSRGRIIGLCHKAGIGVVEAHPPEAEE